jgi:threonyl-tRNA synthetase
VTQKIPNVVVVGEREVEQETVTLRRYGEREQETMPLFELEARLLAAIAGRTRDLPKV